MKMRVLIGAVLGLLATACARTVELEPAAEAAGRGAAVLSTAGVRVDARADLWPGQARVRRRVTPMLVTVENLGTQPLRIQYREFALVGSDDARFAAIPPFPITNTGQAPLSILTARPSRAGFVASNFEVARFYAPLFPTYAVADPFGYEPLYYNYYKYWYRTNLPTPDMLALAMPEGVLKPGGRIRGYLYFEKVSDNLPAVSFQMDLVHPRGTDLGIITIPFRVDS